MKNKFRFRLFDNMNLFFLEFEIYIVWLNIYFD